LNHDFHDFTINTMIYLFIVSLSNRLKPLFRQDHEQAKKLSDATTIVLIV